MDGDRNGKEEGVVGKWKKGEQMMDGQSGARRGQEHGRSTRFPYGPASEHKSPFLGTAPTSSG